MAIFYIKDGSSVYEMTATTEVQFSYTGQPTKFKVESGATITDHYNISNATASFNGIVTSVVLLSNGDNQLSPKQYIESLRALQISKRPFTVYLDDKLTPIKNCLFTTIDGSKGVDDGLSSWRMRLGFEQIRLEDRAQEGVLEVEPSVEVLNGVSSKTDAGNTQAKENPTTNSLFRTVGEGGTNLLKNALGELGTGGFNSFSGGG